MDEREKTTAVGGSLADTAPDPQVTAPHDPALPTMTSRRWLSILQRVTDGAVSHLDLRDLLQDLLSRVREAMEADNAAILLVDDDALNLTIYAARGAEEDVTGSVRVPMGQGVAGSIAASRKTRIISDLSRVEVENPLLRATAHSLVGAPLFLDDRVIGVIHVDSARPRRFTEDDAQLLELLGSRVALAIEHARLYASERAARSEAEATVRRLHALQAVSDVALEHAGLDDLLGALFERIQQMLRVENVAILLVTPDGKALDLYSVRGPEAAVLGKVTITIGEGVAGTIAATRQPLMIENLALVSVANPFLKEHFRSLLGVPLQVGERLIGVLHIDTVEPRRFTDADTELLQILAERISVAIARALEFEDVRVARTTAERRATELQETTDRMDEFLGIASHELRTPLTSLNVNLQILDRWMNAQQLRRPDESEAEYATRALAAVQPLIERSNRSIARLDRIVGDLLEASRIREDRVALQLQRIDLAALVREFVEEQQQAHPDRTIESTVSAQHPVTVNADPDRLGQVVTNYIGNALKFSSPEQPILVTLRKGGNQAKVVIRDHGLGIAEAHLTPIWDRFYRVGAVSHLSGSQVGLGLGLYISREIIARHGGKVGVESVPGKGSTFWFTLPLATP